MNAIRYLPSRNPLLLASVAALLVCAACGGCGDGHKPGGATPQPPSKSMPSDELTQFRKEFRELQIENQRLANEVATLRKKMKKEEEESPTGVASRPTQTAYATAQVDFKNSLDQMMARFDKLEKDLAAAGKSAELSLETIRQIVKQREVQEKKEKDKSDSTTTESETLDNAAGDSAPGGETGEAFETLLKAAGAALCVAQPEICPLVGAIFEAFGLFGSTEERQTFLEAVGNQAAGKPLTEEQAAAVKKAVDQGYGDLHEGLKELIDDVAEKNPSLQGAVNDARKKLLNELGISQEQYEELRTALASKVSNDEKLQAVQRAYTLFPNKLIKVRIVKLASDLGDPELGALVDEKVDTR